jgi:hypothetical protein
MITVEIEYIPIGTPVYFISLIWRVVQGPVIRVYWEMTRTGSRLYYDIDHSDRSAKGIPSDQIYETIEDAEKALQTIFNHMKGNKK